MTKEEILAKVEGDLDRLVAVEVMEELMPEFTPENALGLQLAGRPVRSPKGNWVCLGRYDEGDIPTWRPLPYSANILVSWQAVVKMEELGFYFKLDSWGVEFYASGSDMGKNTVTFDSLLPESVCPAICKAALLARLEGDNQ